VRPFASLLLPIINPILSVHLPSLLSNSNHINFNSTPILSSSNSHPLPIIHLVPTLDSATTGTKEIQGKEERNKSQEVNDFDLTECGLFLFGIKGLDSLALPAKVPPRFQSHGDDDDGSVVADVVVTVKYLRRVRIWIKGQLARERKAEVMTPVGTFESGKESWGFLKE